MEAHPDATELARRLAARARAERRDDAAEDESLAAADLRRQRTLDDVARDLVHRGDRIAVRAGGTDWSGAAVDAGADWLCLETGSGVVDVRLGAVSTIRVVEAVHDGGGPLGRGARSWRARTAEHELTHAHVEVGLTDGGCVVGRLATAARDHVVVEAAGRDVVAPTSAIAWLRTT